MPVIARSTQVPSGTTPGVVATPVVLPQLQNSLLNAQAILNALYAARATVAAGGVTSIAIDGQQVVYQSPAAIDAAISYWSAKVARLNGTRRRVFSLNMDRF